MAKMVIGGEYVPAESNEEYAVYNPANGDVVDTVPKGNARDVERAVIAAERAFPKWWATPGARRGELVGEAARKLHAEALEALEKHIAHRATPEKLAALFAGAGFRLTRVETASVSMRFADGSALLRHYFIKLGFMDGWKSVVREDRRAEVFARLEESLNARSSLGDGLQLTIPLAYVEAAPEL